MILLIDNYDSFAYNLYQMIGAMQPDIQVVRNDKLTIAEIEQLNPAQIILSPGPGRPVDAGVCIDVVKHFAGKIPILGVCLGHQAICEAFGGVITYAKRQMHGKQSMISVLEPFPLFKGLGDEIQVARYHSLAVSEDTLPEVLAAVAVSEDGEIMAVKHKQYDVYGLQFHPESILTPEGKTMLKNFVTIS